MQGRRRLFQPADGDRDHDTVGNPREVAITDKSGAVAEKDAIEKRVRGRCRRRAECQREQQHGEQSNPPPGSHDTISDEHRRSQRSGPTVVRQAQLDDRIFLPVK